MGETGIFSRDHRVELIEGQVVAMVRSGIRMRPEDVQLLIEVMDTSAAYDRNVKPDLYAHSGTVAVWLVDLNREHIEMDIWPIQGRYTEKRTRMRGQSVVPQAFPDVEIEVNAILG